MTQHNETFRPARLVRPLLIAGAAMAVTTGALAGPGRPGPDFPISIEAAQERAAARRAEIDSDGDGLISREEFAAAERLGIGFRHGLRQKGPGAADGKRMPRSERRSGGGDQALFETLDSDGDGKLSKDEFDVRAMRDARRQLHRERMFDRLDRNGDGVLGPDELPDPIARLEAMDADGDGTVTAEEARAFRQSRKSPQD